MRQIAPLVLLGLVWANADAEHFWLDARSQPAAVASGAAFPSAEARERVLLTKPENMALPWRARWQSKRPRSLAPASVQDWGLSGKGWKLSLQLDALIRNGGGIAPDAWFQPSQELSQELRREVPSGALEIIPRADPTSMQVGDFVLLCAYQNGKPVRGGSVQVQWANTPNVSQLTLDQQGCARLVMEAPGMVLASVMSLDQRQKRVRYASLSWMLPHPKLSDPEVE